MPHVPRKTSTLSVTATPTLEPRGEAEERSTLSVTATPTVEPRGEAEERSSTERVEVADSENAKIIVTSDVEQEASQPVICKWIPITSRL